MDVRQVEVGCEFSYVAEVPTPTVFQVQPRSESPASVLSAETSVEPDTPVRSYTDLYGNPCQRLVVPAGRSRSRFARGGVRPGRDRGRRPRRTRAAAGRPARRRAAVHPAQPLLPARHAGDEAWSRFGGLQPGYRRVQAICDHVHAHLRSATAADLAQHRGRRQHRGLRGLPRLHPSGHLVLPRPEHSRPYVFGYLPEMDVHPTSARWTSPRGWRSGSATGGGPSTPATTARARAGWSSAAAGTPRTWPWPRRSALRCWSR